jgi:hypothetical protein
VTSPQQHKVKKAHEKLIVAKQQPYHLIGRCGKNLKNPPQTPPQNYTT